MLDKTAKIVESVFAFLFSDVIIHVKKALKGRKARTKSIIFKRIEWALLNSADKIKIAIMPKVQAYPNKPSSFLTKLENIFSPYKNVVRQTKKITRIFYPLPS